MKNKTVKVVLVVLVVGLACVFFQHFSVRGVSQLRIEPRGRADKTPQAAVDESFTARVWNAVSQTFRSDTVPTAVSTERRAIRIATFNLQVLGPVKCEKPHVMDLLARIARRFDVVAVQEIVADTDEILPRLVDLINRTGQDYDFAVGPRLGPPGRMEQYGFIFNRRTVELDRNEVYTVDDRDDLILREPFVGWFRALGPPPDQAFTFSLVNVRVEPSRAAAERDVLDDVLYAVRDDGRGEDDVIIAGDLRAAPGELGDLDRVADITYAVQRVPTTAAGDAAWDNLVLQKSAVVEFTGRGGVVDFLREYNLTLEQALEISEHLPVWAEFSIREGGGAGRVASRDAR